MSWAFCQPKSLLYYLLYTGSLDLNLRLQGEKCSRAVSYQGSPFGFPYMELKPGKISDFIAYLWWKEDMFLFLFFLIRVSIMFPLSPPFHLWAPRLYVLIFYECFISNHQGFGTDFISQFVLGLLMISLTFVQTQLCRSRCFVEGGFSRYTLFLQKMEISYFY